MDDTSARAPLHWGAETLWQQLEPLLPGLSVEVVARTTSTNTQLLERARVAREPEGDNAFVQVRRSIESGAFGRRAADIQPCLLVAEHQTAGRGRLGRTWKSIPGASLTFSLALPLRMADWSGLSLAVGVALADALEPDAEPGRPRIGLKWPNDLWLMSMLEDAPVVGVKLGGILIETVAAGSQRLAVIGIGLNVQAQEPADAGTTEFGSLQEFEPQTTAPALLDRVALPLVKALKLFEREGFGAFAERYAARDLLRGRPIRTTLPDVPEGVAQGVSDDGALLVQTSAGLQRISSGEVSVRLNPPAAPC
jgi:BirA family transcriptional regulator, biotin operon repressor / biotin---[acetyl-CoA-carboxylase] ligase